GELAQAPIKPQLDETAARSLGVGQVERMDLGGANRSGAGVDLGRRGGGDHADQQDDDERDGTQVAEMGTHVPMVGSRVASRNRSPVPAATGGWSRVDPPASDPTPHDH